MKISKWEAYTNNEREEVVVENYDENTVTYKNVLGWNYGWPITENISRTMTVANFVQKYPIGIDMVL